MKFQSTRDKKLRLDSAEAIIKGLSDDGGLFVPVELPVLKKDELENMSVLSYAQRVTMVFSKFMTDFSEQELMLCSEKAYIGKFEDDSPTRIVKIDDGKFVFELWHGPTCAFKDMALQILPHFLSKAMQKIGGNKKVVILTATSGDTGKAALEGFCDVEGTEIIVFYPKYGVSKIQELQMQTQDGENTHVCGVFGNFDDTQTEVKRIFTDEKIRKNLNEHGKCFSSANSINIGRLIPQIAYYISIYADLIASGEIKNGEKVNVAVPTGNFGNILAAFYAKKMGVPFGKLICASNTNNVLTDFLSTGEYNINRDFYMTESPSMDILVSSNLERLIFELSDKDDEYVSGLMKSLRAQGEFCVSENILMQIKNDFFAGFADDETTEKRIKTIFEQNGYLCDTHTAVALDVYEKYRIETGDTTKTVIVSTASPYKFPRAVLKSISGENCSDDFKAAIDLEELSKLKMPKQLSELSNKKIRFSSVCEKENMENFVLKTIGGDC